MSTIKNELERVRPLLSNSSDNAKFEAELLLAHALQKPRSYLYAWPNAELTKEVEHLFANYIERRIKGEPIAYIIGRREFWSLALSVNENTLIPRPETEIIIETVLKLFGDRAKLKVADLGTGSGAIAIALAYERPEWNFVASDISEQALAIAKENATHLSLKNISFRQGDWCAALNENDFDLIISNPPYIAEFEWPTYEAGLAFEPKLALVSGEDGLQAIRKISATARNYLNQRGCLLLEHGFAQAEAVREILAKEGYQDIESISDLLNYPRVTLGYCFR